MTDEPKTKETKDGDLPPAADGPAADASATDGPAADGPDGSAQGVEDGARPAPPPRRNKLREGVGTIFFMAVATFAFVSAVSLTYLLTRDTIKRNERLAYRRAVLYAAGIGQGGKTVSELSFAAVTDLYEKHVHEVRAGDGTVSYLSLRSPETGRLESYVFIWEGKGLWGRIEAAVGLKKDLKTLTGLDILKQNETPGLGGRISEDWFRDQFRGKSGPEFKRVSEGTGMDTKTDRKTKDWREDQFDAITGATITSKAIQSLLQDLCHQAPKIVETSKS